MGAVVGEQFAVNVGKACGGPEKDSVKQSRMIPGALRAGILSQVGQDQDLTCRKLFVVVFLHRGLKDPSEPFSSSVLFARIHALFVPNALINSDYIASKSPLELSGV